LLSHAESIALLRQLGVDMIPELKRPVVAMPFGDFSQRDFARSMIAEYRAAGITPGDVWPQSFSLDDVLFWKSAEADFGRQAVYLDDAKTRAELPSAAELRELASKGVRIWAPPIWALVSVEGGRPVASRTARDARAAGLELITWSLERPVRLPADTPHAVAAQLHALSHAGATMEVLDVLGRDIGVKGVFSDWPGTVTYYANCMDL
jgi:glycerophosphoryl diester phosphodiesterase